REPADHALAERVIVELPQVLVGQEARVAEDREAEMLGGVAAEHGARAFAGRADGDRPLDVVVGELGFALVEYAIDVGLRPARRRSEAERFELHRAARRFDRRRDRTRERQNAALAEGFD